MRKDSPQKAILVVVLTALVCSSLVSAAVIILRPIQLNNLLLERSRNVINLTGLLADEQMPGDRETLELYRSLDARIVDLDSASFAGHIDAQTFDKRKAARDPETSVEIPAGADLANLGRRARHAPVYLVWREGEFDRIILPMRGTGMWSMLYGFIALESDLNTIAAAVFYEQNETPGLGDQITRPDWIAQWKGRRIFDSQGHPQFAVSEGVVEAGSSVAVHQVDALTGATVTANAVTQLVHYWFGPHGYRDFLAALREMPPTEPDGDS